MAAILLGDRYYRERTGSFRDVCVCVGVVDDDNDDNIHIGKHTNEAKRTTL